MSHQRVPGIPDRGVDFWGGLTTSGGGPGTFGEVWETSGEPLDCLKIYSVRGSRQGTSGEVQGISGKPREFPEALRKSDSLPSTCQNCLQITLLHLIPSAKKEHKSRTKNQPKEEVFGTDIPRTSRGHSRGYPGPKLRSGRSKSWKNKHLGADIHDPKARTSTTLRDFQKLRSEKLWAEFSFPSKHNFSVCTP